MPALGRDALGMELHAPDRPLMMLDAHDDSVLGVGRDLERVRHAGAIDDQRMVARGGEGVGQAGGEPGTAMADGPVLAVHPLGPRHPTAAEPLATRPRAA